VLPLSVAALKLDATLIRQRLNVPSNDLKIAAVRKIVEGRAFSSVPPFRRPQGQRRQWRCLP
jgi:hypothetical protein